MTKKRLLLWLAVAAVCAMIFAFSCQTGDASHEVSVRYASPLAGLLENLQADQTPQARQALLDLIEHYVRKCGHFAEYALLGFFALLLADDYRLRRRGTAAWAFSTFYAATDELHQMLSDGRSAMWQDVLLDSAGAAAGVAVAMVVVGWISRGKRENF